MRKRKISYPPAKTATKSVRNVGFPRDPNAVRPTVATINLGALDGRKDLTVGDRVRIGGGGLYAGAVAIVESLNAGVIPSATVRTLDGATRRVRAIDLEPVPAEQ